MFSFKVIARSLPAICVVASAVLYLNGDARAGGLLALLAFASFAIALLAKKL